MKRDDVEIGLTVGVAVGHDSGIKHVSGRAAYVDDLPEPNGTLYAYIGQSAHAHARVSRIQLHDVRAEPGVVAVLAAEDVPGENDISCIHAGDEPLFAKDLVQYVGQPLFAVIANTIDSAKAAARKAAIDYELLEPILTIDQAMQAKSFVLPPRTFRQGDPERVLQSAPHRLTGSIATGGQEHFYLEGQVSLAIPKEDGDVVILCSTQNPSEIQHVCARVLAVSDASVAVEVRRMGGAFGGKETQATQFAAIAALAASQTGHPVKIRLDRDDDMCITGKRHAFDTDYEVGFDETGRIQAVRFVQKVRCGFAADLSGAVADRGIFHCDNAYYLEHVSVESYRCKTNTASDTAFRGFGVPQGVIGIERVILDIAHYLDKDPLEVRKRNLYRHGGDTTHYGQRVENFILPGIIAQLEHQSNYFQRRSAIEQFNRRNGSLRRGISLTPVMMGICFSRLHLNQAGALIHVYKDGSIGLNHGGTEMGQGLFTKVAQIVANGFGVKLARVKITATTTEKVPNTSATASSAGTDLNGMAAMQAVDELKRRLIKFAAEYYSVDPEQIVFLNDQVLVADRPIRFEDLVACAYLHRVPLSATGFYKTLGIGFDHEAFRGTPFLYFAYGAAVSEVVIDTLTGEYRVERVDILHDVGQSLNPAIDIGQIEGGFIQGMGWLTTEELWWDAGGRLRTHAPSTYKIPAIGDRPTEVTVKLMDNPEFRAATPYLSKAVGEPPLILAISVHQALLEAVRASGVARPQLDAPATPERVLYACSQ